MIDTLEFEQTLAKEALSDEDITRFTDEFEYLFELQESGVTNMFGAAPWLQEYFDWSLEECRFILKIWMKHYAQIKAAILGGEKCE